MAKQAAAAGSIRQTELNFPAFSFLLFLAARHVCVPAMAAAFCKKLITRGFHSGLTVGQNLKDFCKHYTITRESFMHLETMSMVFCLI
jgi:hypothetical protein